MTAKQKLDRFDVLLLQDLGGLDLEKYPRIKRELEAISRRRAFRLVRGGRYEPPVLKGKFKF